jgi:Kef-type K+ transport system membrane component KefB/Trk K+ transport system NAD-binding subunit
MNENTSFIPLLVVVLLAFLVPFLLSQFKRLNLPIVVGEIIAGILIGRSGLALVAQHDPLLDLLSEFGFVFLMFISGLEIDFSSLGLFSNGKKKSAQESWGPVQLGSVTFGLTLALSIVTGLLLTTGGLVQNPWMIALILSTTSLGVVVPVLKERGLSNGIYGQSLLIASLIADFATMLLITVEVAALSRGLTLDLLLIGLLFVAFFFMYHFGMWFFNGIPAVRKILDELSSATAQIKVRAAFTMMLIFIVLSEVLGTEIILGAFLAGAILSLLRKPQDIELIRQVEAFGFGFFIPIFFIMVGVDFNLQSLISSPQALLMVPIFLVAAALVKLVPALIFRKRFGWRETFGAGVLLSSRLSLIIAASAIGLRLGVLNESVNSAIILVAIITVTVAPLVFIRIIPESPEQRQRPVLISGAGELGLRVAEQLRLHQELVIVLDGDQERLSRARQRGFTAIFSPDFEISPQAAEWMDIAKALVCTHNDINKSYWICRIAHTEYGIEHLVAQISSPNEINRFKNLGVATMNAALDRAALMALITRNPALYQLLTSTEDDKEVSEIVVVNPALVGKKIREITFPGDVLILALRRNGELLIPHGNTQIEEHDHLTLAGNAADIETAGNYFASGGSEPARILIG